MPKSVRKVREPVQVYLDAQEKALLEEVAVYSGLSQAEVLRRGLRRVSADLLAESAPGASFQCLIGALEGADDLPSDLAAHHDEYLYQYPSE